MFYSKDKKRKTVPRHSNKKASITKHNNILLKSKLFFGQFFFIKLFFWVSLFAFCSIFFPLLKQNIDDVLLFWLLLIIFVFAILMLILLSYWSLNLIYIGAYNQHCGEAIKYVDALDKAICILNAEEQVVFANKAYQNLWNGKEIGTIFELLGRKQKFAQGLYRLKFQSHEGKSVAEEFCIEASEFVLKDFFSLPHQEVYWISVSASPSPFSNGDVIWQIEDITATRLNYQKHFQDLQKIMEEIDQAPAALFVANGVGELIFFNATFSALMHLDFDQNPSLSEFLEPSCLKAILHNYSGKKERNLCYLRTKLKNKKAQTVLCDLYFQREKSTSNDEDIIRFVAIEICSQASLIEEEAMVKGLNIPRIFDSLPAAAAFIDKSGKLKYLNQSFANLLEGEQAFYSENTALLLDDLVQNSEKQTIKALLEHVEDAYQEVEIFEGILKNNPSKHIQLYFHILMPEQSDNFSPYFLVIGKESTKQKALEAQLDQNQKMQAVGQLAGGIAHDFNNVLTAITMSCDLLLNSHRSSDPSHPDLINIKNNATRAAALVQQLLAFSRRQTMSPEQILLTDLLSDLRIMIIRLIGPTITLMIHHEQDLQKIYVDQTYLQRVIMNLALNARDAMPQGGQITMTTKNIFYAQSGFLDAFGLPKGDYVSLKICDNGSGIAEDVKDKIFEPFFTTKEVGKGTGLGLSMVYGIVKQMGGAIYCESEVGKGTSFEIFLPAMADSLILSKKELLDQKSKLTKEPEKFLDLTGSATLLIVEDEDAVRLANVRALKSRGYHLLEAASGLEALEIIREQGQSIDLVISDVVMPEMDGPTLLCEVQKLYPDLLFIFVSGYAQEAFSKNLPKEAQFHFLPKPFSLKTLITKVKDVLAEQKDKSL